jgi:flagellin-like protein
MKSDKKGISPVIATVFIIMLTVAAVAVIASFVVPFVKRALYQSTECVPYKEFYDFEESFGYNCYQEEGNLYGASVKAGFDKTIAQGLEGFDIVFIDEQGSTKKANVRDESAVSHEAGKIWLKGTLSGAALRAPGAGETLTYIYNSSENSVFVSAEVYPVLKTGRICEKSASIKIIKCTGNIG